MAQFQFRVTFEATQGLPSAQKRMYEAILHKNMFGDYEVKINLQIIQTSAGDIFHQLILEVNDEYSWKETERQNKHEDVRKKIGDLIASHDELKCRLNNLEFIIEKPDPN